VLFESIGKQLSVTNVEGEFGLICLCIFGSVRGGVHYVVSIYGHLDIDDGQMTGSRRMRYQSISTRKVEVL